jgi:5'(3')-deoxyribonucleotidase
MKKLTRTSYKPTTTRETVQVINTYTQLIKYQSDTKTWFKLETYIEYNQEKILISDILARPALLENYQMALKIQDESFND